jgi:hypothetical protein
MLFILAAGLIAQEAPAAAGPSPTGEPIAASRKGKSDYVDLEAGAGYSTNPFLAYGSDTGRAFGRISAHAVHSRWTERSSTTLSAYGEDVTYLGRYGSKLLGRVTAHHDEQTSETLRLFGDVDASLDRGGQLGTRFIGSPSVLPVNVVITPGLPIDPNVDVFADGRTYRFSGQVGAQLTTTPRDTLSFSAGYSRSMFRSGSVDSNVSDIFGTIGYNRRLDERTTVGAQVSSRQSDYDGRGKVRVITPQFTFHKAFSPETTVDGALGVSFARLDNGLSVRNTTGLAGNVALCHAGQKDHVCATVARSQQTSSIAGPATSLSAGIDYGRQIDANQSIQFNVSASRYTQQGDSFVVPVALALGRSDYVSANGSYSRKLGNRLYAGVSASVRKLYQDGANPKADVGGSVFLRYRLGDLG